MRLDVTNLLSDHHLNDGLLSRLQVLPLAGWRDGLTLRDLRGRRNGTLTNGPTWTGPRGGPGRWGAINLGGSPQHVAVSSAVVTDTPVTVAAWARPASSTTNQDIVSLCNTGSDSDVHMRLNLRSGGSVEWFYANRNAVATTNYAANAWLFATGVSAANDDHRAYINGGSKGTSAVAGTVSGINALNIGRLGRLSPVVYFTGQVDWVAVWNRALSDSEIAELFQLSRRPDDPTLNWLRPVRVFDMGAAPGGVVTPYYYQHLLAGAA